MRVPRFGYNTRYIQGTTHCQRTRQPESSFANEAPSIHIVQTHTHTPPKSAPLHYAMLCGMCVCAPVRVSVHRGRMHSTHLSSSTSYRKISIHRILAHTLRRSFSNLLSLLYESCSCALTSCSAIASIIINSSVRLLAFHFGWKKKTWMRFPIIFC